LRKSDADSNELHVDDVALQPKPPHDGAPGTGSRRLQNASTNPVDLGALGGNAVESMKTSKVVPISGLTRKARVLASFETATE
jgi:hypothetical protein